jgi:ABC-type transport system involved in cytochrome c biogenesis permease subunit
LVYIIFGLFSKVKVPQAIVSFLAFLILGVTLFIDPAISPLMPALQSKWMGIHVAIYLIGYGGLTISFVVSLLYLFKPDLSWDILSYRLIAFAFPFLTIGMTTGSVWANVAWGTYWGWDPKETCSLITGLVYVIYLHLRILKGWKGKRAAYLSVIGFLVMLFTFVGVNFILSGLHSYN